MLFKVLLLLGVPDSSAFYPPCRIVVHICLKIRLCYCPAHTPSPVILRRWKSKLLAVGNLSSPPTSPILSLNFLTLCCSSLKCDMHFFVAVTFSCCFQNLLGFKMSLKIQLDCNFHGATCSDIVWYLIGSSTECLQFWGSVALRMCCMWLYTYMTIS